MDPSKIYILFYKAGLAKVQSGFILASNDAIAKEVGHAYCNAHPAWRFVNVKPAILADESILSHEKLETETSPPAAPPMKRRAA